MIERRLSYQDLEDGVATLILFENEEIVDDFYWSVEDMPDGAEPGDQYHPEFEDGELVALQYDEELTEQTFEEHQDALDWYNEILEEN